MSAITELHEKTMSSLIVSWPRAYATGVLHLIDTCLLGQKQGASVIYVQKSNSDAVNG